VKSLEADLQDERMRNNGLLNLVKGERKALTDYKAKIKLLEQEKNKLDMKVNSLNQELQEKAGLCEDFEGKVRELQQLEMTSVEERYKMALSDASNTIRVLERENRELKAQVRSHQEKSEKWMDDIHIPLLQQLYDVNTNVEKLIAERDELKCSLSQMLRDKSQLLEELKDFKKSGMSERYNLVKPSLQIHPPWSSNTIKTDDSSLIGQVELLVKKYLRAESYRKSLAWQKKYLLVVLKGYQEEEKNILAVLKSRIQQPPPPKRSFRGVVILVMSTLKMRNLVKVRQTRFQSTSEIFIRSIAPSKSNMDARDRDVVFSPPTKERLYSVKSKGSGDVPQCLARFNQLQECIAKSLYDM